MNQRLTSIKVSTVVTLIKGSLLTKFYVPLFMWSRLSYVMPYDKFKTFHLHFHKLFKHKNWPSGNLGLEGFHP